MKLLSLPEAIAVFLDDLRRAERSAHTVRAYTTELRHLIACHDGLVATITVDTLRAALARRDGRSPASRARTLAALNRFLTWAVKHDLPEPNPPLQVDRVRGPGPAPRGLHRAHIDAVLA